MTASAIKVYRGVSIYKVAGSANWYVRVWDREKNRYIVKTTGVRTAVKAREVAKEFALELLRSEKPVDREFTFRHFALKCLAHSSALVEKGERNSNYARVIQWAIQNESWGLLKRFGSKDVRSIRTQDFRHFIEQLEGNHPHLSSSTKNTVLAAFRNVLKVARDEGVIDHLPDTPRTGQRDNPRPFFRFHPLVIKENDAYKKLLDTAKEMGKEGVVIRGVPVTDELYDLILFVTHSFVRPIVTELFALKHNDVTVADDPKRLIVGSPHPTTLRFQPHVIHRASARGKAGYDGVERISTQDLFDLLELPQRARSAGACRRLAGIRLDTDEGAGPGAERLPGAGERLRARQEELAQSRAAHHRTIERLLS